MFLQHPPSPPPLPPTQTLYSILNLPTPTSPSGRSQTLTTSQIKAAYRRALLNHHPDKAHPPPQPRTPQPSSVIPHANTTHPRPSIDAITYARDVLSNPAHRRAYDKQLLTSSYSHQAEASSANGAASVSYSETVDLDDMQFEEGSAEADRLEDGGGVWRRRCRCGDEGGFELTEAELRDAADGARDGRAEVVVGCRGCSLVVRVLFCAVEDVDEEGEGQEQEDGDGRSQGAVESEDVGHDIEHTGLASGLTPAASTAAT